MSLDPKLVSARLAELRIRFVPETVEDAARRLDTARPGTKQPFEQQVAARLAELRALYELARYLHHDVDMAARPTS